MAGRSYAQLRALAPLNFEFFAEDIQNRGTAALTMTLLNTPRMSKTARGSISVEQATPNDYLYSTAAIPQMLTPASAVTFELVFQPRASGSGSSIIAQHFGASGGWRLLHGNSPGAENVTLYLYDAAGALARTLASPVTTHRFGLVHHMVLVSTAGGTSGWEYANREAVVLTLGSAGVVANGPSAVLQMGGSSGLISTGLFRGWNEALSTDESQLLYDTYRSFIRPSMV